MINNTLQPNGLFSNITQETDHSTSSNNSNPSRVLEKNVISRLYAKQKTHRMHNSSKTIPRKNANKQVVMENGKLMNNDISNVIQGLLSERKTSINNTKPDSRERTNVEHNESIRRNSDSNKANYSNVISKREAPAFNKINSYINVSPKIKTTRRKREMNFNLYDNFSYSPSSEKKALRGYNKILLKNFDKANIANGRIYHDRKSSNVTLSKANEENNIAYSDEFRNRVLNSEHKAKRNNDADLNLKFNDHNPLLYSNIKNRRANILSVIKSGQQELNSDLKIKEIKIIGWDNEIKPKLDTELKIYKRKKLKFDDDAPYKSNFLNQSKELSLQNSSSKVSSKKVPKISIESLEGREIKSRNRYAQKGCTNISLPNINIRNSHNAMQPYCLSTKPVLNSPNINHNDGESLEKLKINFYK